MTNELLNSAGSVPVLPEKKRDAPSVGQIHPPALPALTGVRFFAAFYVVMGHATTWFENRMPLPGPLKIFLANNYLAVCLFFLLSGFILAYTYSGYFSGFQSCARFWEARFARIYPVYLLSLLLVLPFQYHQLNGKSALAVIFMVQAWNPLRPSLVGAWNYPAWSLSVEAFFYLCFPFIQYRIASLSRTGLLLLAVIMSLLSVFAHTPFQGLSTWTHLSLFGVPIPLPILRFPEFLLGMAAGNFFVRFGSSVKKPFLTAFGALAAIVILCFTSGPWVSLVVLPFTLFIYCLASSRDAVASCFSNSVMLLLGGASYAIYLLQLPVRDWVRTLLASGPASLNAFNAPLTPIILVLFSIFVFRYWEEPLRKTIRRTLAAS